MGEHMAVPIARALAGEADTDVRLRDGDILTIRQLAGWTDIGSLITVKGEVMHPGDYGIQEGERLSSVIARAGGLRSDAYPYGAILERRQVRELEEKNRADILEFNPDGSDMRIYAYGIRNAGGGLAITPYPVELTERWATPGGERLTIRPIRPEDAAGALLEPQSEEVEGPYSGSYRAGGVWAVLEGSGEVTVNGRTLTVEGAGCYELISHERSTSGELALEPGPGVRCYAVCFTPGLTD